MSLLHNESVVHAEIKIHEQSFTGFVRGAKRKVKGEIVVVHSATGYQHILTDPSYAGQIVLFTTPYIGITGFFYAESTSIWPAGIIVRELSGEILEKIFIKEGKVCITNIDTRALISAIKKYPKDPCEILIQGAQESIPRLPHRLKCEVRNDQGKKTVILIDYGVKEGIIQEFIARNCKVILVPPQSDWDLLQSYHPQGYVISNGPGDPKQISLRLIQKIMQADLPVMGICLGHQLMALSLNARSYRMEQGEHGSHYPVMNIQNNQGSITAQNHNYAIDENTLPPSMQVSFRSMIDRSVAGLINSKKRWISFQGHPEGSPGPKEVGGIFDQFFQWL